MDQKIPVGISNRHIHLSLFDFEKLFGRGASLQELKPLSQPGQFAAKETVKLIGPKGEFPKVRVLGPLRKQTQVEISLTDSYILGIEAPIRESGHIEGTPGLQVVGPKGEIILEQGVIIACRHIHFHPSQAQEFGVEDGQRIQVKTSGERALIFDQVLVRVDPNYRLDCHLDMDEGNAAGLKTGDTVEMIGGRTLVSTTFRRS